MSGNFQETPSASPATHEENEDVRKMQSHNVCSSCDALLRKVQLLEKELTERNQECASLRTENRVMHSYSQVLKTTQGELLRLQHTCTELQASNASMATSLRDMQLVQSKAEHKDKMDAIRRKLDEDIGHHASGASKALPLSVASSSSSGIGGMVPMTHGGSEVVLPGTSAISSLGFASSTRVGAASSGKTSLSVPPPAAATYGGYDPHATRTPQPTTTNVPLLRLPNDDTDAVNHLLAMVRDADAHDTRKQQMDMDDEDGLLARFAALQQRR